MKYYLAYGSNLNVIQMKRRCPGARPIGRAFIPNYRLAFKGSLSGNYLTIVKSKNNKVPVIVWEISEENEASLDRYEGYPVFYRKHIFKKIEVTTFRDLTEEMECFAYIMNDGNEYGMPTGTYYMTCSQGYKDFRIDDLYLDEALEFTYKMSNRKRVIK